MNNLPDEDPQLTNFLRQYRSIAPPPHAELEDRLMVEIDLLSTEIAQDSRSWWRYLAGAIALVATGIVGGSIHQMFSPPDLSVAELQQLNLYLEAHAEGLSVTPDADTENHGSLDIDLLTDGESEDS
jgi:hypothetical protein